MNNQTPEPTLEQAIENLAVIADQAPLNGPHRRLVDASIAKLADLVKQQAATQEAKTTG